MISRLFLIIGLIFFTQYILAGERIFRVAVEEFNTPINPEFYQYHPTLYLLRQLHETLFTKGKDGLESHILRHWDSTSDFTKFNLCLKKDLYFSNSKVVTTESLQSNLQDFNDRKLLPVSINKMIITDDCLQVVFASTYFGFTEDMQSLRMAILDPQSKLETIPVGISPYQVEHYDKKQLVLKVRAENINPRPYFDQLIIDSIGNRTLGLSDLSRFHEINLLSPEQIPNELLLKQANFKRLEIFDLANVYLFVNNNDSKLREIFKDCINRNQISKSMNWDIKEFSQTIMPKESGTKIAFVQNCRPEQKLKAPKTISLLYYYDEKDIASLTTALNASLNSHNI